MLLLVDLKLNQSRSFFGLHICFTQEQSTMHFTPRRNKKISFDVKCDFINKIIVIIVFILLRIKNWVGKCHQEIKKQLPFLTFLTSSFLISWFHDFLAPAKVFSCKFCEIFQSTYSIEHLWTAVSTFST